MASLERPTLCPHHPGALGHPLPDVEQLDLIRVHDVDPGLPSVRVDRHPAALGLGQVGCEFGADRIVQHSVKSPHFLTGAVVQHRGNSYNVFYATVQEYGRRRGR